MGELHPQIHEFQNFADNDIITTCTSIGGRLRSYVNEWEKLTSDSVILQAISGYKLEFFDTLDWPMTQSRPPMPYRLKADEVLSLDIEIQQLLQKDVIELSHPESGQFISNIFTRPKKDGGYRMILDLSELNQYIVYRHFKMDTFDTAKNLVTPHCYMASLDLRDAYYSVPIADECRKFLKFQWRNKLYQYKALPNGLSSGPRLFTKILKPPFASLRSMGHMITGYIDDTFLVAQSKEGAEKAVQDTARLLERLGFIIHPTKSVFTPKQEIQYLGFIINSQDMEIQLTAEKKEEIKNSCINLLAKDVPSIKTVASVIGKLVAAFPAVQYGPLYYRTLEKDKTMALRKNFGHYDRKMQISLEAKHEINWWIDNIDAAYSKILRGAPDLEISSDASGLGWGATDGTTDIGGRWKDSERLTNDNNINYLELLAAFLALKSFCSNCNNLHVKLNLDNTTAVAYISHMGGSKSHDCNGLAKELWLWCIARSIWVSVAHLPGVQNVTADRKSRHFQDETEWMLNEDIFHTLCDEYNPEIDLFASRLNAQLPRYVSWKPDPEAEAVDALSYNWGGIRFYAFPPFCIIGKCLKKISEDSAEGMMIVPKWPTQPWFPQLLHMLTDDPVNLPRSKVLLTQPGTGDLHPLRDKLNLICCRLSGNPLKVQEYQQRLQTSSCLPGGSQPSDSIMDTLTDGSCFVVNNRVIHCRQIQHRC